MLVKDTQWIVENDKRQAMEKHHAEVNGWVQEQLRDAYLVADPSQSIANIERQAGKPLSIFQFKSELKKIKPSIKFKREFIAHPMVNKFRWTLYHKGTFITAVDDLIPEWSIFSTREQIGVPRNHELADKTQVPEREISRGWRTVLVLLVFWNLITPTEAENFATKHGSPDRPSWSHLLGKSQQTKGVL